MIRLNVSLLVEESDKEKALKEVVTELVAFSLRDTGCINYDFYKSETNGDRYLILETWEDKEALKAHQETDHFKRLAPRLHELATVTSEVFEF